MLNQIPEVASIMDNVKGNKVLDIGTGNGDFLKFIIDNCSMITSAIGIDVKDSILKSARENLNDTRIKFINAKCDLLPFEDNSFNIIGISNVLHHLRHKQICIGEISRVLCQGDFILVNEQIPDIRSEKQKVYHLSHNFGIDIDEQLGLDHFPIYSKTQIESLFPVTEFRVIDTAEYAIEISDEEMKETIPHIISHHNNSLQKFKHSTHYIEYKNRFMEIQSLLNSIGFAQPCHFFMLLKKI